MEKHAFLLPQILLLTKKQFRNSAHVSFSSSSSLFFHNSASILYKSYLLVFLKIDKDESKMDTESENNSSTKV